ncbi:helix-turn-helix domain-containing protein [Peribacillus simplex]|uniref:helix-turn-helix domain-containing protein n=1 Tax=Peribacillus simplex TaxID=1478 RepID=UPI003D298B46
MAKGKYEEWLTNEGLLLIEGWARDGLTDEQIAYNMGIGYSTLQTWKSKYQDIQDTLKKGKEVVDRRVENALLKRALGYEYDELTYEQVPVKPYRGADGKMVEYELDVTKKVRKQVTPDTTAQIFWLKNRKPAEWRDKQEINHSGETTHNIKTQSDLSKLSVEELKELETILSKTSDTE